MEYGNGRECVCVCVKERFTDRGDHVGRLYTIKFLTYVTYQLSKFWMIDSVLMSDLVLDKQPTQQPQRSK